MSVELSTCMRDTLYLFNSSPSPALVMRPDTSSSTGGDAALGENSPPLNQDQSSPSSSSASCPAPKRRESRLTGFARLLGAWMVWESRRITEGRRAGVPSPFMLREGLRCSEEPLEVMDDGRYSAEDVRVYELRCSDILRFDVSSRPLSPRALANEWRSDGRR